MLFKIGVQKLLRPSELKMEMQISNEAGVIHYARQLFINFDLLVSDLLKILLDLIINLCAPIKKIAKILRLFRLRNELI